MMEGSFRKSASMNNLAQFDQLPQESTNDVAAGYASDDVVHPSGRSRERKRGMYYGSVFLQKVTEKLLIQASDP